MLSYLKEREKTYYKRYIRIGKYIAGHLNSGRLQKAIDIGEECRTRYQDYLKLRQDYEGVTDKQYVENLLKKESICP